MPKSKSGKTARKSKIDDELSEPKKRKRAKKHYKTYREAFYDTREKIWNRKRARLRLHRSFKRSYREDYKRGLNIPGLVAHASDTMRILRKNWKLFLPLLICVVVLNIFLVGIMNQDTYKNLQDSIDTDYQEAVQKGELGRVAKSGLLLISTITSGGLSSSKSEVQQFIWVFLFSLTWLITIYFLRHLLAGNHPKFRDGIYNALTPLISSYMVMLLVAIHMIPIMVFVIIYSTAVSTDFLSTPFYAFLFWVFGGLLLVLSGYLLPTSILALVATSVPGMYPMPAIHATTDLIQGRRIRFWIRIIFLVIYLAVIWVIIGLPLLWLDLVLKEKFEILAGVPFASIVLQVLTTFTFIYAISYIYLLYRRMLDDRS